MAWSFFLWRKAPHILATQLLPGSNAACFRAVYLLNGLASLAKKYILYGSEKTSEDL